MRPMHARISGGSIRSAAKKHFVSIGRPFGSNGLAAFPCGVAAATVFEAAAHGLSLSLLSKLICGQGSSLLPRAHISHVP